MEKHFISYSCIFYIKVNALRSFWANLIKFSKFQFFQIFDRSTLFFDRSKMFLKSLQSLCVFRSVLDWYWINRRIFDRSNLFFDRSKIGMTSFKKVFFTWFLYFFKSFQNLLKRFCLLTNRSKHFLVTLSFSSDLFA